MDLTALTLKYVTYKPTLMVLMAIVGWPLISAVLNLALRKKTAEQWEAWALAKPGLAFLLELMRALGVDPKKAMKAFHNYAQRQAGNVPAGAIAAAVATPGMPPAVVALLNDPTKMKLLEEAAQKLAAGPPKEVTPTVPEAVAPQPPPAT